MLHRQGSRVSWACLQRASSAPPASVAALSCSLCLRPVSGLPEGCPPHLKPSANRLPAAAVSDVAGDGLSKGRRAQEPQEAAAARDAHHTMADRT